jgi:hypothetical protein
MPRDKTWMPEKKTTKALVSRPSFYRFMLKMFLGDAMDHSISLSFVVQ